MTPREYLEAPSRPEFRADFADTLGRVRGALTELVAAIGADPARPQVLSRSLGINKNLSWKLSRLVLSRDACEAVQHVPGTSGVEILLAAFAKAGASRTVCGEVRAAMDDFEAMVGLHAGNRAGLELLVGSMFPERLDASRREANRKLSFQGNSSTWGVQADTQLAAQLLMPNAKDPGLVDLAAVSGMIGFRRLRPVTRWAVQYRHRFGELASRHTEPIDPSRSGDEPPLLSDFSENAPHLVRRETSGAVTYELSEGPVGNSATFTCVFGSIDRALAPIYGEASDDIAEFSAKGFTPVERVVFDLFVHRDLPFPGQPEVRLYSSTHGHESFPLSQSEAFHLYCDAEVTELGCPPVVATPHVRRYTELISLSAERLGAHLGDFRGYRYEMRYPPVPATHLFFYPLPRRSPSAGGA